MGIHHWGKPASSAGAVSPSQAVVATGMGDMQRHFPVLVATWLLGVMIFSVRLAGGWWFNQRLRTRGTGPLPESWQRKVALLRRRLKMPRATPVLLSLRARVPMVIGLFKPVVLVPASVLTGLPAEQIEAVLAHELAHVRRLDPLANLLQAVTEILFFYHPAAWWISSVIRREREHCCDELAVNACGNPLLLARALVNLQDRALRLPQPGLTVVGGRNQLYRRILLMTTSHQSPPALSGRISFIVIVAVTVMMFTAWMNISIAADSAPTNKSTPAADTAPVPAADTTPYVRQDTRINSVKSSGNENLTAVLSFQRKTARGPETFVVRLTDDRIVDVQQNGRRLTAAEVEALQPWLDETVKQALAARPPAPPAPPAPARDHAPPAPPSPPAPSTEPAAHPAPPSPPVPSAEPAAHPAPPSPPVPSTEPVAHPAPPSPPVPSTEPVAHPSPPAPPAPPKKTEEMKKKEAEEEARRDAIREKEEALKKLQAEREAEEAAREAAKEARREAVREKEEALKQLQAEKEAVEARRLEVEHRLQEETAHLEQTAQKLQQTQEILAQQKEKQLHEQAEIHAQQEKVEKERARLKALYEQLQREHEKAKASGDEEKAQRLARELEVQAKQLQVHHEALAAQQARWENQIALSTVQHAEAQKAIQRRVTELNELKSQLKAMEAAMQQADEKERKIIEHKLVTTMEKMDKATRELVLSKEEFERIKVFLDDLRQLLVEKEVITDDAAATVIIDPQELEVNGALQPAGLHNQALKLYQRHMGKALGGRLRVKLVKNEYALLPPKDTH
jgi:beta-lactamase regulating signal transducer with metallopeptidase domain